MSVDTKFNKRTVLTKVAEHLEKTAKLPQMLDRHYVLADEIPEDAKIEAYRDALDDLASRKMDDEDTAK